MAFHRGDDGERVAGRAYGVHAETVDGNDAEERWLYIYAVTDTAEVFVSRFG